MCPDGNPVEYWMWNTHTETHKRTEWAENPKHREVMQLRAIRYGIATWYDTPGAQQYDKAWGNMIQYNLWYCTTQFDYWSVGAPYMSGGCNLISPWWNVCLPLCAKTGRHDAVFRQRAPLVMPPGGNFRRECSPAHLALPPRLPWWHLATFPSDQSTLKKIHVPSRASWWWSVRGGGVSSGDARLASHLHNSRLLAELLSLLSEWPQQFF